MDLVPDMFETFVKKSLVSGMDANLAFELAIHEIAVFAVLNELVEVRPNATPAMAVKELKQALRRYSGQGKLPDSAPYAYIVVDAPGPLVAIPRAACLDSLLPKDRPPTEEEFDAAWRRCRGLPG